LLFNNRFIINLKLVAWLILSCTSAIANSSNQEQETLAYTFQDNTNSAIQSTLEVLEQAQGTLGQYVYDTGERIDLFFGYEDTNLIRKGSRLDILLPITLYDNSDMDTSVNFRVQIDLPRTHRRWKLFLASFEQSLDESLAISSGINESTTSLNDSGVEDSNNNSLGAIYNLFESDNTKANLDFGVNASSLVEFSPFVRVKLRYRKPITANLSSRLTQNLFWETDRGGAIKLKQTFDYTLNKDILLRSQTSGVWWHTDEYAQINQSAILFNKLNSHRMHAYYVRGQWDNNLDEMEFSGIATGFNWREKLYKDWLFAELEPKLTWQIEDNFNRPVGSVMLMVEMRFYRHK